MVPPAWLAFLRLARAERDALRASWCLMSNHYHLAVRMGEVARAREVRRDGESPAESSGDEAGGGRGMRSDDACCQRERYRRSRGE